MELESIVTRQKKRTSSRLSMSEETLQTVQNVYGVENWSSGYFGISSAGTITVAPTLQDNRQIDLKELVDHLVYDSNVGLPLLLRFPQILTSQLSRLSDAYRKAIQENNYQGEHCPVFPMKVNPRREVVETFLKETVNYRSGLECGSKPELFAAVGLPQPPGTLLLCNGFKDESFVRTAMLAVLAGKRVAIVVEKLNELRMVINLAKQTGVAPLIGLRAKLYSRGSGKWASSGGEAAKFGLTTSELLECVRIIREANLLPQLKLLHFHIGSQITDIRRVKKAMKEAARVYAKLRQIDCEIEYLDIGGGLGVDYDGSKTRFESSVNYSVQEFANDVIYVVKSTCEEENVTEPNIVTESGRFMTAYHTVLITSIRDEIETFADNKPDITIDEDDPQVIMELKYLLDNINGKNYAEFYHDALEYKDSLHTQFNLGLISLEDRSKGEVLFWEICNRASKESESARLANEEFESLKKNLASKYLCNFSMFRSAPDSWAIEQLFPIVPIHRLNEQPTDFATLVDVTCDSDGKIDRFVDLKDVKSTLEIHDWKNGEDYFLGIFLVGAYQEVMGNSHNLFGNPNEAQVMVDPNGGFHITKVVRGSSIEEMVQQARYDTNQLVESYRKLVMQQVLEGELSESAANQLIEQYASVAQASTYLD